jgi:tetratricopeptide (TPR) repeat protein
MPHLSALQKEYQDKNVTIVGVNIWERSYSDETLAAVQKFVNDQADKMAYTVAYDGPARVMDQAYMAATGSRGIPTAFVIDQRGRVAWFGHPDELEFVLEEVVAGSYDIQAGSPRLKKFQALMGAIFEKLQETPKDALAEFRKLEREFPKQAAKNVQLKEYLLLAAGEYDEAYQLMRTRAQQLITDKDAMGLNDLAWTIVDPESDLAKRDLALALEAATKSAEFTNFENAAILDTLAMAHFRQGNLDEAIKFQTKAVDAAPAGIKEELAERLEEFKAARTKR